MALDDATETRAIQRELVKRYVDYSRVNVRVIHGVCFLQGTMAHLRTHPTIDLEHEADLIRHILRQRPAIRDVVWDVQIRQ